MKKILLLIFACLILSVTAVFANDVVLKGGVSVDKVPKGLYGEWRVTAKLVSTNSIQTFKKTSLDLWNLSRVGNVITLDNPFTGAHASIVVDRVDGNLIRFKKIGNYDNGKKLIDVVQLTLSNDVFSGVNYLDLQTISNTDNSVIKSERAEYKLYGEKINGESIK